MAPEACEVDGYVRVSTDEQAAHGVSLDAQEERIRSYCKIEGLTLGRVYRDAGESADGLDRPGLITLRSALRSGAIGGIVVAKLDRLTRRLRDWTELLDEHFTRSAGGRIFSPSGVIDTWTAAGRFVVGIQILVAELELDTIHERTADAMSHKRSRGERIGGTPYGWGVGVDGKKLDRDEAEQYQIEWMRQTRAAGWSFQAIAFSLNERGIPTKNGVGKWYGSTVAGILSRSLDEVA